MIIHPHPMEPYTMGTPLYSLSDELFPPQGSA